MSTQLKLRRGTTAQHSTFTGASGEITVDTTKKTVVVHDGSTAGGVPLAKESDVAGFLTSATAASTYAPLASPTFSGSITASSGTANGVAYLNGSKVLTTGSALTFDGTNLGVGGTTNYGAGTATATVDASAYSAFTLKVGGVRYGQLYATTSALTLDTWSGTGPIIFSINTGEQMRLTSTGLGIGTSSPFNNGAGQGALEVKGASYPVISASTASISTYMGVGSTGGYVGTRTNHNFAIVTNDTGRLTVDTSGNLGLGITPSAWTTPAFQVKWGGIASYSVNDLEITNNTYNNGSFRYIANGYATSYVSLNGQHIWQTAPSGTAGNAISFTQAMTLDASGRLCIGSTSPIAGLDVRTASSNISAYFLNAGADFKIVNASGLTSIGTSAANPIAILTSDTERMRIDSSGNVLIQSGSLQEHKSALAANDISLSTGNYFTKTISGATTFTVSNVPASGTVGAFILELTNGGSATVTWFAGVKWASGTAPTLTAAGVDIVALYTHDGGTTWRGAVVSKDSK